MKTFLNIQLKYFWSFWVFETNTKTNQNKTVKQSYYSDTYYTPYLQ